MNQKLIVGWSELKGESPEKTIDLLEWIELYGHSRKKAGDLNERIFLESYFKECLMEYESLILEDTTLKKAQYTKDSIDNVIRKMISLVSSQIIKLDEPYSTVLRELMDIRQQAIDYLSKKPTVVSLENINYLCNSDDFNILTYGDIMEATGMLNLMERYTQYLFDLDSDGKKLENKPKFLEKAACYRDLAERTLRLIEQSQDRVVKLGLEKDLDISWKVCESYIGAYSLLAPN